ncbi:Cell shape-determining protein [Rubrobacter radiotolerans]|uniref:Cell shape-determining protein MreC n=1 Tax=Rubrobacter radiotolerans TaxID=42256 RepID=A0A023X488_RUBRA|nr:rod shape-determining protein MreC [Rubrobacter radiotolerans]AHY46820.1 Cell shape-determining protein [Rubrobacter radiotolerans]MDX5894227.1 rod shape-determining protein MreC [Rubrobacter radiotolerans]SMC05508.1 rod shape-determining protein MreC [Rubrobacter radiotolerans DSM 5868]
MGRRRTNPTGGLAALFVFTILSLALFTVYVREGDCSEGESCGPLHTVQLGAAEVLGPVQGGVALAASPLGGLTDRVANVFSGDRNALREELSSSQELAARASQLERENAELRRLLDGERAGYEYAPLARVIAPVGEQLTQRVTINVGTADGVGPEQPVIVGENTLVGRTTSRVSRNTAEVMLITDQNFSAGVTIVPPAQFDAASGNVDASGTDGEVTYGEGLLRTNIEGYFAVEYVDLSARAEPGDFVITSGRSGGRELLFPPGLLVGTVETASSQDIEQYKRIVVSPNVNPSNLEEVRVITGW